MWTVPAVYLCYLWGWVTMANPVFRWLFSAFRPRAQSTSIGLQLQDTLTRGQLTLPMPQKHTTSTLLFNPGVFSLLLSLPSFSSICFLHVSMPELSISEYPSHRSVELLFTLEGILDNISMGTCSAGRAISCLVLSLYSLLTWDQPDSKPPPELNVTLPSIPGHVQGLEVCSFFIEGKKILGGERRAHCFIK